MSVEDLMSLCERVIRVLKTSAAKLRRSDKGWEADAALFDMMARSLERALRSVRAAPEPGDDTPQGIYLDQLLSHIDQPYTWVTPGLQRWIVKMLRRARTLMRDMLAPLEIFAGDDVDLIGDAQRWIGDVDHGPDISSDPSQIGTSSTSVPIIEEQPQPPPSFRPPPLPNDPPPKPFTRHKRDKPR